VNTNSDETVTYSNQHSVTAQFFVILFSIILCVLIYILVCDYLSLSVNSWV